MATTDSTAPSRDEPSDELAYYLPAGPQPSAERSRVERFLTALFVPPAVHRYRLETRR